MAKSLDPRGLAGVQDRLAAAHPAPDEYYASFMRVWEACHARSARARPRHLARLAHPVRPVPRGDSCTPHRRSTTCYYRSPAPFEWPAVHDYVVTPIEGLRGRSAHASPARVERQRDQAQPRRASRRARTPRAELAGLPVRHSRIGQIAAVDCATRIAMFLGGTMAEGWACYATDLMEECGLSHRGRAGVGATDARADAGARVRRPGAAHRRAHVRRCGARCMRSRSGCRRRRAHGEAVKNSMFPGTALMYWLGTSQIHTLRARDGAHDGRRLLVARVSRRVPVVRGDSGGARGAADTGCGVSG